MVSKEAKPSVSQLQAALAGNPLVNLVGDLEVMTAFRHNGHVSGLRRDFFVEPKSPLSFGVLSDREVEVLESAASFKSQPTLKFTRIPRQFTALYNAVLEGCLPSYEYKAARRRDFGYVSNLHSSRVELGSLEFDTTDRIGGEETTRAVTFDDPRLQAQAELMGEPKFERFKTVFGIDVHVRLLPPGMCEWVYRYEKGYYQDGNIAELSQRNNTLVWDDRYVDFDTLNPRQLQALARGQFPFPELKYLEKSVFEGDPKKVGKIMKERILGRESSIVKDMFGAGGMLSNPEDAAGSFDEVTMHLLEGIRRQQERFRGNPSSN